MRFFKNLWAHLPLFLLWGVISAMLWGWIFTFVTDTAPENKVTVYCHVPAVQDTELAARLEETMPEGLRMIKVHSFDYVMFGEVTGGDVYIIPASEVGSFAGDLAPVDGVFGVKVYDAASGAGAALSYIRYGGEDYCLFLGAGSVHLTDGKALEVAKQLTEL